MSPFFSHLGSRWTLRFRSVQTRAHGSCGNRKWQNEVQDLRVWLWCVCGTRAWKALHVSGMSQRGKYDPPESGRRIRDAILEHRRQTAILSKAARREASFWWIFAVEDHQSSNADTSDWAAFENLCLTGWSRGTAPVGVYFQSRNCPCRCIFPGDGRQMWCRSSPPNSTQITDVTFSKCQSVSWVGARCFLVWKKKS